MSEPTKGPGATSGPQNCGGLRTTPVSSGQPSFQLRSHRRQDRQDRSTGRFSPDTEAVMELPLLVVAVDAAGRMEE